jgi:diacylglycerol kinase (ATP)
MSLKTQVIVNPESNQGRTRKRWKQIKESLRSILREYKYEFTEKPLQAIEICRSAIKDGIELIVGVGGDGTINEIANGFYENTRIINPETMLGVLPSGTGCDFSRSLSIPKGFRNAARFISETPASRIDVGKISYRNHLGADEDRYFLNISDFGIGGEVIERMKVSREERKASSYFKSLVTTFINYKAKRLHIKVDDRDLAVEEYMVGAVSNGKIFGKGMKIAPNAQLDDGLFDLVLVKRMGTWEFLRNVYKLYRGTHLSHPKVLQIRGRSIEARADERSGDRVLIEVDGEQVGTLPATFELMPKSIPVIGYL